MLHLFAFSPSQCAPIGSAEPSTNTFLVTWAAHNLLIALPALPTTHILLWFAQTITFSPVYLFYIFEFKHVCICFIPMCHSFSLSNPVCSHRLSRATMGHHTKGSALLSWPAKSNLSPHSFVGTHSCLTLPHKINPHLPSSGSMHQSPQLKWQNTFIPQQWH